MDRHTDAAVNMVLQCHNYIHAEAAGKAAAWRDNSGKQQQSSSTSLDCAVSRLTVGCQTHRRRHRCQEAVPRSHESCGP